MKKIITLSLLALIASPAASQSQAQIEKRYTPDYRECVDTSDGITSAMMDCIGTEIERQDARLNQAYAMVMRPLPPVPRQHQWHRFEVVI